ncbi:hypothetical protein BC937DRAFT_90829 [Endogone sp. FLAS-F59071]|nr:hypothetical protein BC937DRAFT_90829 [Endogone sp. FLAS-F59071]|eukprot:RUS16765.1 hypothetical protein BC937DRAFT_90829 [Endogone sp. FLAS-F59071]
MRGPKLRYRADKAPIPDRTTTILDMPSSEFFDSLDRLRLTLVSLQNVAFWDALVTGLSELLDVEYCFAVQNLRACDSSTTLLSPCHSPTTHSPSATPGPAPPPEATSPSAKSMYSHRLSSFWSTTSARHSHHNYDFDATFTPCSDISRNFNRILLVSSGLVARYPHSPFWESLSGLLPDAQLAVPVLDIDGAYLGYIAIMLTEADKRRHGGNPDWAMMEMTVRVLAERASGEMRRQRLEKEMATARRLREHDSLRRKWQNESFLSHEIRTPLQGIIGLIELLFPQNSNVPVSAPAPTLTAEQADLIASLRQSSTTLLRLLDTMTNDKALENGQLYMSRRWCDIRDIVGDVTSTLCGVRKEVGEQESVDIRWHVDDEVPEKCFGGFDALRLKQALSTLMDNALKVKLYDIARASFLADNYIMIAFCSPLHYLQFTSSGSVTLTVTLMTAEEARKVIDNIISLKSKSSQSRYVKFTVEDTGIGIPPAKRQLLFKSSSQVDTTCIRPYEGKGLGLTFARSVARLMGGTVWLEHSVVGEGSVFSMCTIVTDENAPQQEKATVEALEGEPSVSPASTNSLTSSAVTPAKPVSFPSYDANLARTYPLRIMVVEDNAVTRELAIKMLAKLGYRDVIGCCHGQEAVEKFQRGWEEENVGRDLVLMDCWMPVMDGFESTRRILDYFNDLPTGPSTSASADPQDDDTSIPRKRKRPTEPANPPVIVAITADNTIKNRENVIKAGMTAMVVKPFVIAELQNMIVKLFGSCSTSSA